MHGFSLHSDTVYRARRRRRHPSKALQTHFPNTAVKWQALYHYSFVERVSTISRVNRLGCMVVAEFRHTSTIYNLHMSKDRNIICNPWALDQYIYGTRYRVPYWIFVNQRSLFGYGTMVWYGMVWFHTTRSTIYCSIIQIKSILNNQITVSQTSSMKPRNDPTPNRRRGRYVIMVWYHSYMVPYHTVPYRDDKKCVHSTLAWLTFFNRFV